MVSGHLPVPERVDCGAPPGVAETRSVAPFAPADVGALRTRTLQLPLPAKAAPAVQSTAVGARIWKSAVSPENRTIDRAPEAIWPWFLTWKLRAAVGVPTSALPYASDPGLIVSDADDSIWQAAEQPSPGAVPQSSQVSFRSRTESPQVPVTAT